MALDVELIEHVATVDSPLESELNTYSRPLPCSVGDETYNAVVARLKELMLDRIPRERKFYAAEIKEAKAAKNHSLTFEVQRKAANLEKSIGLDYSDDCKEQGSKAIEDKRDLVSLSGVPCVIGDSHKLAYDPILFFTKNVGPITLLRFDAHNDCYSGEDEVTNANYVMKLLEKHPERFSEVITLNANYLVPVEPDAKADKIDPRFIRKHTYEMFHSVPILSGVQSSFVGHVRGPAILDIDLDGLEVLKNHPGFGPGGRFWTVTSQSGVHYYNQRDILMHPFEAALGLRAILTERPLAVLVHTERTYRNRYFHHRVEYDFLRALAVDDPKTLNS